MVFAQRETAAHILTEQVFWNANRISRALVVSPDCARASSAFQVTHCRGCMSAFPTNDFEVQINHHALALYPGYVLIGFIAPDAYVPNRNCGQVRWCCQSVCHAVDFL